MLTDNHYHNGLLLLAYLIIAADGVLDDAEKRALEIIAKKENIDLDYLSNFVKYARALPEKAVYNQGLDEILKCSDEQKLDAFCWLYRISEVDGKVHVKEVRFLLYSLRHAGLDLEDVLKKKDEFPSLAI